MEERGEVDRAEYREHSLGVDIEVRWCEAEKQLEEDYAEYSACWQGGEANCKSRRAMEAGEALRMSSECSVGWAGAH